MRRNAEELDKMRRAGRVVAEIHQATRGAIRPGVSTAELDKVARQVLDKRGAGSNFLN
jgi:methionyl aminopeptidase